MNPTNPTNPTNPMNPIDPIYRQAFAAQQLMATHPPRPTDTNKHLIFGLTCRPDIVHAGQIHVSRWPGVDLPPLISRYEDLPAFQGRGGFFTYEPPKPGWMDWHVNFAHWDLFAYYDGPLFAQDEMQVTEHPALASVRHVLLDGGLSTLTMEGRGPTPILIAGVERRCAIATEPDPARGRPQGLYGNYFAQADRWALVAATKLLDPPTVSNILAMEAPANGRGRYTETQLRAILTTAYTGFRAVMAESQHLRGSEIRTAVHTGYWGCGAYGGNRVLMPLLQMLAAAAAGISALIFYAGADREPHQVARMHLDDLLPPGASVPTELLIRQILAAGYRWGVGDGT